MDILFRSLAQYSGPALLILCVLVAVIILVLVMQSKRRAAFASRWQEWLRGSTGESLEALLERHLVERKQIDKEIAWLRDRVSTLERELLVSKRHVGLVRYDAFEDVRGNQSFALALYDDNGDGAILNGIVGRADNRLYCKQLLNGRSERNLSQEEQRAIKEARADGPKTIVSQ